MAVGILGTGSYLPVREVTNAELATLVPGAEPSWIARKTLIAARRFAAPDEPPPTWPPVLPPGHLTTPGSTYLRRWVTCWIGWACTSRTSTTSCRTRRTA